MSRLRRLAPSLLLATLLFACGSWTARKLQGSWESEPLPKRTLELRPDGSYTRRLSGKTLGFLSEVVGPERGSWRVEGESLVLFSSDGQKEKSERLVIKDFGAEAVTLGGERWVRWKPGATPPTP